MKLSIITINRNNADGLARTMASVFGQSFNDLEYIIVDGASTDGSVQIAEDAISKQTLLPSNRILFSSEHDSGIYNAMNKGIAKASGDYLFFLNSGDSLAGDSLSCISNDLTEDFIIGRETITKNGIPVSTTEAFREDDMSLFRLFLYGIPHQAALIKRSLFDNEKYDETLKINSDWKFFVEKIVIQNASVRIVDTVFSFFDGEGLSSTNEDLLRSERVRAFKEIVPPRIADDYLKVFPHYYEVKRLQWLLRHRFFYKLYRFVATVGMKLVKE